MGKIKIGLFGFGVVGQGIYEVVRKSKNANAEIVKICVRSLDKPRSIDRSHFTDSPAEILDNPEIDLIVEVIDDAKASYDIVKSALLKGIPVGFGQQDDAGAPPARNDRNPEKAQRGAALRRFVVRFDSGHPQPRRVLRQRPAARSEGYPERFVELHPLARFRPQGFVRQRTRAGAGAGIRRKRPSFDIGGYDSLFKLVIITVHALGTYVAPERIFTYGISTIHDADIQYAREKNVKIKLVAQVVKVSDEHFTMFVMPEFVTPAKYIYSVDDEYNGVVIRGECYDRQFMFGKGAGSLPTASSILSDIMARLHGYRYEYKKLSYIQKPDYTTDITLKIYVRYTDTDIHGILNFTKIHEQYTSEKSNYVIGDILLSELIAKRDRLCGDDVFVANIPIFFLNRD